MDSATTSGSRISAYLRSLLLRVADAIDKADPRVLIFILLCGNFLGYQPTPNEENYLALAKQYVDPQWIPGSESLNEWPGTRVIFQWIVGFCLQFFTFEAVTFTGRLISFALFSLALGKLFSWLKFRNLEILFLLQSVYLSHQTFFADEVIFQGFEPKTLAYVMVFYSLHFLLSSRYAASVACAIAATYLHVLVGGWFFIVLYLYLLFKVRPLQGIVKLGLMYLVAVIPFAVYLGWEILLQTPAALGGVNLDWIYVYFRNPHHLAPFVSKEWFYYRYLPGICWAFGWLTVCILWFQAPSDPQVRALRALNTIIALLLLFALVIASFDRTGVFLKYYPFRIAALGALLVAVQVIVYGLRYIVTTPSAQTVRAAMLALALPTFCYSAVATIHSMYAPHRNLQFDEMAAYLRDNSDEKAVVLLLGSDKLLDPDTPSFSRKARREQFSVYKFVPAGGKKLYSWYVRVLEKEKAEKDIAYVDNLRKAYKIDYVVTRKRVERPGMNQVFANKEFYVYGFPPEGNLAKRAAVSGTRR